MEVKFIASGPRFASTGSSVATLDGTISDADWYFKLPPIVAYDQQTVFTTFVPDAGTIQNAL